MSGITASVTMDDTRLRAKVAALVKAMDSVQLLESIGLRGLKWINDNFEVDGGLVGGWEPLSEVTISRRRKESSRPLQDTGLLRSSFSFFVDGGRSVTFGSGVGGRNIRGRGIALGTRSRIASTHQFGMGRIPARPMMMDKATMAGLARGLFNAAWEKGVKNGKG